MNSSRVESLRIFNSVEERINLLLTPIMLTGGLIFYLTNSTLQDDGLLVMRFLALFVGMNLVHGGLTFALLFRMPAFRQYLSEQTSPFMKRSVLVWTTLFFVLVALVRYSRTMAAEGMIAQATLWLPLFVFNVPLLFWSDFHVRRQVMGLSLLYNYHARQKVDLTEADRTKLARLERLEKWVFYGFSLTMLMRVVNYCCFYQSAFNRPVRHALFAVDMVFCASILLCSLSMPRKIKSGKTTFLLRTSFFALENLNLIFGLASQAAHGLEYFFLARKMTAKPGDSPSRMSQVVWLGLFGGLMVTIPQFVLVRMHHFRVEIFGHQTPFVVLTILALARATTLMHFYTDGFIFRFRDASVRKNILPLLEQIEPHDGESRSAKEIPQKIYVAG